MVYLETRYLVAGDQNMVVEFGDEVDMTLNQKVHNVVSAMKQAKFDGVRELIPTYRSILVNYDPSIISFAALQDKLEALEKRLDFSSLPSPREVEIPVALGYGEPYKSDIEFVAQYSKLGSVQEVIELFTSRDYLVYMIGFLPGFAYLGGMPERLATPRLDRPRISVPAGSVGIAGEQCGIYPIDSPGGWRCIGRTPLKLFEPSWQPPSLLQAGDRVRFASISPEQYEHIALKVKEGTFKMKVTSQS
ncbi:MAG: 5-oxoprolinase subunit PxpB [Chloroflexota bacterium]|nr:MAG: 5-oxoprolinase subunit PxpB [Chloroflexota bacterium]